LPAVPGDVCTAGRRLAGPENGGVDSRAPMEGVPLRLTTLRHILGFSVLASMAYNPNPSSA
jgi:hypothetical protein